MHIDIFFRIFSLNGEQKNGAIIWIEIWRQDDFLKWETEVCLFTDKNDQIRRDISILPGGKGVTAGAMLPGGPEEMPPTAQTEMNLTREHGKPSTPPGARQGIWAQMKVGSFNARPTSAFPSYCFSFSSKM